MMTYCVGLCTHQLLLDRGDCRVVAVDDRWVVLTEEHRVVHLLTYRQQEGPLRILEMCSRESIKKTWDSWQ